MSALYLCLALGNLTTLVMTLYSKKKLEILKPKANWCASRIWIIDKRKLLIVLESCRWSILIKIVQLFLQLQLSWYTLESTVHIMNFIIAKTLEKLVFYLLIIVLIFFGIKENLFFRRKFMNYGMKDFFEELKFDLVSYSSGPFPGAYAASKGNTSEIWFLCHMTMSSYKNRIIISTRRSSERSKINFRASQTSSSSSTSHCILASSYSLPRVADFCPYSTRQRSVNQWSAQCRFLLFRDERIYDRASSPWTLSRDIAAQLLLAV